jgi:hypothetical protein
MNIIQPQRIGHSYTQHLHGTPAEVFPLLCPVREVEWVNGWDPRIVITASGFAEDGCVFMTGPADNEAIWVVTHYEPPNQIEFLKVTPDETLARITIGLRAEGEGETHADIRYEYTALSKRGARVITDFTAEHYADFMTEWEQELNHYLDNGSKLVQ